MMTDYFPLLSQAIGGLEKNTGDNRRALYERARAALVNQLRSVAPPLAENEITRERLALEEAIRKIEAQIIKQTLLNEIVPAVPVAEANSPSLRDLALRHFSEKMTEPADEPAIAHSSAYEDDEPVTNEHKGHKSANEAAESDFLPITSRVELAPKVIDKGPFESEHPPAKSERPPTPPAWSGEDDDIDLRLPRDYGRIIKIIVVLLLLSATIAVGYWQRETISAMVADFRGSSVQADKSPPPLRFTPKISDRIIPPSEAQKPAGTSVPQKVVLYEEDANNPQGQRFVGSAIWRTETVSPGSGIAPELAVRVDVEIPEKHMRMSWSIRRNVDPTLPASHTIEVMFTLPPNLAEGGIGNVPGTLMKQGEQARGVPLAGLSVKVTNNYFLIGLSAVDVDKQRNIQSLKDRDWLDIPIVYTSGKRAILALEKGTPGARAFEEAFRTWGE